MISAVLFISFFVFLILGVPIALCLGSPEIMQADILPLL